MVNKFLYDWRASDVGKRLVASFTSPLVFEEHYITRGKELARR